MGRVSTASASLHNLYFRVLFLWGSFVLPRLLALLRVVTCAHTLVCRLDHVLQALRWLSQHYWLRQAEHAAKLQSDIIACLESYVAAAAQVAEGTYPGGALCAHRKPTPVSFTRASLCSLWALESHVRPPVCAPEYASLTCVHRLQWCVTKPVGTSVHAPTADRMRWGAHWLHVHTGAGGKQAAGARTRAVKELVQYVGSDAVACDVLVPLLCSTTGPSIVPADKKYVL